jgi:hypothetical protein
MPTRIFCLKPTWSNRIYPKTALFLLPMGCLYLEFQVKISKFYSVLEF